MYKINKKWKFTGYLMMCRPKLYVISISQTNDAWNSLEKKVSLYTWFKNYNKYITQFDQHTKIACYRVTHMRCMAARRSLSLTLGEDYRWPARTVNDVMIPYVMAFSWRSSLALFLSLFLHCAPFEMEACSWSRTHYTKSKRWRSVSGASDSAVQRRH